MASDSNCPSMWCWFHSNRPPLPASPEPIAHAYDHQNVATCTREALLLRMMLVRGRDDCHVLHAPAAIHKPGTPCLKPLSFTAIPQIFSWNSKIIYVPAFEQYALIWIIHSGYMNIPVSLAQYALQGMALYPLSSIHNNAFSHIHAQYLILSF